MKTIYIFGNPMIDFDNLPLKLAPRLQENFPEFKFIIKDPNENLKPEDGELLIIDTVVGPKDVIVLEDLKKIELSPSCSMHDFDLGFNLKLLQKIGQLKRVKIFGIPSGMKKEEAFRQLSSLINKL